MVKVGATVWGILSDPDGNEDWKEYKVADQVGEAGGNASVHKLIDPAGNPLVGKFYNGEATERLRADKIHALRLIFPSRYRLALEEDLEFVVFPRRVLIDRQDLGDDPLTHMVGFSMNLHEGFYSLTDLIEQEEARRFSYTPDTTLYILITMAHQLARLHDHAWRFVFSDMTPNNVLVSRDYETVRFIDVDSYQFSNGAYDFPVTGLSPGYISPDAYKRLEKAEPLTTGHDDFLLAIIISQMLMADHGHLRTHPFNIAGEDKNDLIERRRFTYEVSPDDVDEGIISAYRTFPDEVREAFRQTFTTDVPVTASEWAALLQKHRRYLC
jgi:DNA-binding helix-hairpin-helix protein with protein kinase domain